MNNEFKQVDDGLDTSEIRLLLEITQEMARGINRKEFNEILMIYNKAIKRLSNN